MRWARRCADFTLPDSPPAPYWVLATDSDGYALVYSCTDFLVLHAEFAWMTSRQPTLAEETVGELRSALSCVGVDVDQLLSTNQDPAYYSTMNLRMDRPIVYLLCNVNAINLFKESPYFGLPW